MSTATANKTIAVHLNNIRTKLNIRYGWNEDNILAAYDEGIAELRESILTWGFKYNEPLEIFETGEVDAEGNAIYDLGEGHRRKQAALSIWSINLNKSLGDGLAPGEVWCYVSQRPKDVLTLLASQFDANKSQNNTKMDLAKAIDTAFNEMPGKKSEKLEQIGKRLGGLTRQTATTYFNVFQLPVEVKDWIQESELVKDKDESNKLRLSFSTAGEITNYYKVGDASTLLLEALARVNAGSGTEDLKSVVTVKWLHNLASEMKLGKPAPKKEEHPVVQPQITIPVTNNQPQTTIEDIDFSDDDNQSTNEVTIPTNLISPNPQPQQATQPTKPQKQPQQPQSPGTPLERIKTQILTTILKEVGEYFVDGKSDLSANKFIIELPIEVGEKLAELVAVALDPNSNKPSEISVIEDTIISTGDDYF